MTITGNSGSSSFAARNTPKPSPSGRRKIGQHQRRPILVHRLQRLTLISGLDDGMPLALDSQLEHRPQ